MVQIWQRVHLKWDVLKMRDFTVTYGVCAFIAGQLLTPYLLKVTSARAFTTFASECAVAPFSRLICSVCVP